MTSPRARRRASESGHTLSELLIASSILGAFAVVIAMASAFSGREMGRLRNRATSATDMRIVVEHLRRDLGAADTVEVLGSQRLRIRRDAVAARLGGHDAGGEDDDEDTQDPGIEYRLQDGVLRRTDKVHNQKLIIASDLRGFLVDDLGGDVHVTIETGPEGDGHRVALQWLENE
ncbi:MAG: hypothetical protein QNJ98_18010 [Planctomycetota bacterium]|nr:hypothetical protein [Planctomycetota bacterium]